MVALKLGATPEALVDPTPTGAKRVDRFWKSGDADLREQPLDLAALRRKYAPERGYAPRMFEGTFRVPLGVTGMAYERERNEKVRRFLEAWSKRGFDWLSERRVQVYPGMYPAVDVLSGLPLLGEREFIVRAWFRHRSPKPVRLELPPHLLRPVRSESASISAPGRPERS